jgi:antitoxin FitA
MPTNLVVRNLDEDIVQALKQRAAQNGVSAEAEHRAILRMALTRPQRRPFNEVLMSMPDAGLDSDFELDRE